MRRLCNLDPSWLVESRQQRRIYKKSILDSWSMKGASWSDVPRAVVLFCGSIAPSASFLWSISPGPQQASDEEAVSQAKRSWRRVLAKGSV
eukprot:6403060-Amphidinium_carterae.2